MPSFVDGALPSLGHQPGSCTSPTLQTFCCPTLWSSHPVEESASWAQGVAISKDAGGVGDWVVWLWNRGHSLNSHKPDQHHLFTRDRLAPPYQLPAAPNLGSIGDLRRICHRLSWVALGWGNFSLEHSTSAEPSLQMAKSWSVWAW